MVNQIASTLVKSQILAVVLSGEPCLFKDFEPFEVQAQTMSKRLTGFKTYFFA